MAVLKKAQVETFGLLIIVILLVFIAVFALKLATLQPDDKADVKDSIIANNAVTAITKVSICQGQQLSSILKNCNNKVRSCNEDSCQLLTRTLSDMMMSSGFKQEQYKILAATKDKELMNIGSCNAGNRIASSPFTVYLDGSSAILKVYLCS